MKKIILKKKNEDGSYDNSPYLFDCIDLYHGDNVAKTLELSPAGNAVKNVKVSLVVKRNDIDYDFLPEEEDSYYLVNDKYPGMKIHFEDKNGIKFRPDKNGVVSITNVLAVPLDISIHIRASKFTVKKISETLVLDDLELLLWSHMA